MYLIPWPAFSFRDQSCTDILDLYHKLKSEISSGGEAEVRLFGCMKCTSVVGCVAANSNLSLNVFLYRLTWMWTRTLQEHLQDIG